MGCRSVLWSVTVSIAVASGVARAQAPPVPAKPLDLSPSGMDRKAPTPSIAEDAGTLKQRKADCQAQAQKLFASQQKKFMKECMAAKS
jgi:hypothetical protein